MEETVLLDDCIFCCNYDVSPWLKCILSWDCFPLYALWMCEAESSDLLNKPLNVVWTYIDYPQVVCKHLISLSVFARKRT